MSYYAEKTAALAAGRPWPPPKDDQPPAREHEWEPRTSPRWDSWKTPSEIPHWHCRRCGRTVIEHQKPPFSGCRRVNPEKKENRR